jgi:hypothetical protein
VDMTGLLLRAGAFRPHVLVASMPGAAPVRLAAEDLLRQRGWPAALTPADADILLLAGTPADDMTDAVEAAWAAVPAPRARAWAAQPGEVAAALDAARAELASAAAQRRGAPPGGPGPSGAATPLALPRADRGGDRDGLRLDRLHVPLGPLLPDWPAGLLVRGALHGDVLQRVEVQFLGLAPRGDSFWDEPWRRADAGQPVTAAAAARRRAAAHLDSLGRFLAVACWDDAAAATRTLRDEALSGSPPAGLARAVRRLARRMGRSGLLAWSTRGLGILAAEHATGPAARAAGDVTDRYRRWCADLSELSRHFDDDSPLARSDLDPPRGRGHGQPPSAALLALLPGLLEGTELAAARLIIASVDPDPDELAAPVLAARGRGG